MSGRARRLVAVITLAALSIAGLAAATEGVEVETPIDEPTTTTTVPLVEEPTTTTSTTPAVEVPVEAPTTTTTVPRAGGPSTTAGPRGAGAPGGLSGDVGIAAGPPVWHSDPGLVELIGSPGGATSYWRDSTTETPYGGSVAVNVTCTTTYVTWIVRMSLLPKGPPFAWTGFRRVDIAMKKDASPSDSITIPTISQIEDATLGDVQEDTQTTASFTPYCHDDPWDSGGSSGYSRGNANDRLESDVVDDGSGPPPPPTPLPPTASFTFAPLGKGTDRYKIAFVAVADDPDTLGSGAEITKYEWDFDDGNGYQTLTATPTKQYPGKGTHTVKLRVTDNDGTTTVVSQVVKLVNKPPEVVVEAQRFSGRTVHLDAKRRSTDDSKIERFAFDCGGGELDDAAVDVGQATCEYDRPGLFTITVRAIDDEGATGTTTYLFDSGELVATIDAPVSLRVGEAAEIGITVTNASSLVSFTQVRPALGVTEEDPADPRLEVGEVAGDAGLAPGQSVRFVVMVTGVRAGSVELTARGQGRDTESGTTYTSQPSSSALVVEGSPALVGRARRGGATVASGTSASSLRDLVRGDVVTVEGTGWDPRGGPISLFVDGQLLRRFGAASRFQGTYTFPGFAFGDGPPECQRVLIARQDGVTRRLPIVTDVSERILFARGLTMPDGTAMPEQPGAACRGWNVGLPTPAGEWDLVTESVSGRFAGTGAEAPFVNQVPEGAEGEVVRYPAGSRWVQRGDGADVRVDAVPVFGAVYVGRTVDDAIHVPGSTPLYDETLRTLRYDGKPQSLPDGSFDPKDRLPLQGLVLRRANRVGGDLELFGLLDLSKWAAFLNEATLTLRGGLVGNGRVAATRLVIVGRAAPGYPAQQPVDVVSSGGVLGDVTGAGGLEMVGNEGVWFVDR